MSDRAFCQLCNEGRKTENFMLKRLKQKTHGLCYATLGYEEHTE